MSLLTYRDVTDVFVDVKPTLESVVFRRTGCRETAQDIAQDLFFKLDRLATRFASYHDARCFLIRMAVNAATDHHRVAHRRAELLAEAGLATTAELEIEEELYVRKQMARIEEALAELPTKCREVLYLSRIQGMTHAEIATRLGVSRSLVDKYAVRALLHCRAKLTGPDYQEPEFF